jgi:hypothetical protein
MIEEKTSVLLRTTLQGLTGERVTLGEIVHALRRRSFGGIFIILSALSLIPGVAFVTGPVIMILALQMLVGMKEPKLPKFIREHAFAVKRLIKLGDKYLPWIEKIEHYVKPRLSTFTSSIFFGLYAILIFGMAILIAAPMPLSNFLPSVAVFLISLGLIEKDGLVIIGGAIMAACGITVTLFMTNIAADWLMLLVEWF